MFTFRRNDPKPVLRVPNRVQDDRYEVRWLANGRENVETFDSRTEANRFEATLRCDAASLRVIR